jgi:hypothetical protein
MKKILLPILFTVSTLFIFSQSSEDNLPYSPNKNVKVLEDNDVETSKNIKNTDSTYFVAPKEKEQTDNFYAPQKEKKLNSQEFYEVERQKQLEQTRSLYQRNENYYADRLFRYGFQVATQTIFPF